MEEQEVRFGKEESLYGTLTRPSAEANSFPAILILSGSGDIDRDGNNEEQKLNLYNRLAEALTELGFVTLRYDKEGTGKSAGDFLKTGLWDFVDGAKSALHFLKEQPNVDKEKVFILGHSEGSILAPQLAKDEELAGLILLSGGTETLHEAMVYQRTQVIDALKASRGFKWLFIKFFKVTKKVQRQGPDFDQRIAETSEDAIPFEGSMINAKWFREHFAFDVKEPLKEVQCPVLAVIGDKDIQATPEKAKDITSLVQGEAEVHIIPDMNHMLREQKEKYTMLELKKAYEGIGDKPLAPQLVETLKSWLERHA